MHPEVELAGISSKSYLGQKIADLYPSFYQIIDLPFEEEDNVIAKSDVVFASLPHGLSEPLAKKCDVLGKVFIDLGADFRLDNEADYQEWYHLQYQEPQLHKRRYMAYRSFLERISKQLPLSEIQDAILPASH